MRQELGCWGLSSVELRLLLRTAQFKTSSVFEYILRHNIPSVHLPLFTKVVWNVCNVHHFSEFISFLTRKKNEAHSIISEPGIRWMELKWEHLSVWPAIWNLGEQPSHLLTYTIGIAWLLKMARSALWYRFLDYIAQFFFEMDQYSQ